MMQDRELLEGVFEDLKEEMQRNTEQRKTMIIGIFCSLCIGLYLFFLLFGNNSWSALLALKSQKTELEERAKELQEENVNLQKIIFELKGLEPTHEEF